MYYIEHEKQPDVFKDIPTTLLWSAEKFLANGNNSSDPQTITGQVCLSFIALLGFAIIGIPSVTLVAEFLSKAQEVEAVHCPNCSHKFRHKLHVEQ